MEWTIGDLGKLSVAVAFVAALAAVFTYAISALTKDEYDKRSWLKFSRIWFGIHAVAVIAVIASLFDIIYNHRYEYHYAWSHSSNNLPVHYMISCFWEGQEGSFLLWIFWHVLIGAFILRTLKGWEAEFMSVFMLVQAFLVSMILGVAIFETKLGSSPFVLLRDAMDLPIFITNPDFVPDDGSGLNPLLQNYWMVIHPPTLFLGFALTLVPFAFCMAGLWKNDLKGWVTPALPWSIVGAMILGVGIMMGAYWAYETLNFGGYWNWDPVENAVYIPWLVLVAAIHVMIVFRRNNTALKTSMILVVASFILVLYATFLTRSGILGDTSVHSFTDLGLSGQLLLYLLSFLTLAIVAMALRWKQMPTSEKELSMYNREFWIFMGATTLCLASFQVFAPTSIPVFNAFVGMFGAETNLAPPADQEVFYTKYQLWFGIAIALLSGTGQFFFWQKMDRKALFSALTTPITITLLISSAIIALQIMTDYRFIILLTVSLYSILSNSTILLKLFRTKSFQLSGGAVSHIGIAMILLGIMFSSGYSNTISINPGRAYNSEFPEEMNKEHLLLFRDEPRVMMTSDGKDAYKLWYVGPRMTSRDVPGFIDKEILMPTPDPFAVILREDVVRDGKTFAKKGDTIHIYNENIYYEIAYERQSDGKRFSLYPRVQDNPQMGMVPSPDIVKFTNKDVYTHVTNIPQDPEWKEPQYFELEQGDTFAVNGYVGVFDVATRKTADQIKEEVVGLDDEDLIGGVHASLRFIDIDSKRQYDARPSLVVTQDELIGMVPATLPGLGIRINLEKLDPKTQRYLFSVTTAQKDWVIMKAVEKPLINILWIGTILMAVGMSIATVRRFGEIRKGEQPKAKASNSVPRTPVNA